MDVELSQEDQAAVGWAVTAGSPAGQAVLARMQAGEPALGPDDVAAIREEWDAAGRPAPRPHVHRTAVELADGTVVTAVSFAEDDPYGRDVAPAFGLYLDARWSPPWPHAHTDWPDFEVPDDTGALRRALLALLQRARAGDAVEIGCLGGHGRTGTALACLAVLTGTPADEAVAWVRERYCAKAIETDRQIAFAEGFGASD
ncbi:MAG: hypothetical protein PV358_17880 [Acidimicrobiales bacterium]|nr:hypothetical protein [Acidimicrobiales bacterium]